MHTPSDSLLAHRYWGVTFDSLLFDRALIASTCCDPRMLPCILNAVHRRLIYLLATGNSCLDTTVLLLTKEHEEWQAPEETPSQFSLSLQSVRGAAKGSQTPSE